MSGPGIQEFLFQRIKEKIPPTLSLADVVSDLLHVSTDSAYRRIRGETPLVLEEAATLCKHFSLSLDNLLAIDKTSVTFIPTQLNNSTYSFEQYLRDILNGLKLIDSFDDKQVTYLTKDVPLFYHFMQRPLFAFRYFFWMKSILQHPDFIGRKFSVDLLPLAVEQLGAECFRLYSRIPCTEIWNTECANSVIRQIEYYHEASYFNSDEDVELVYSALRKTLEHLKVQAEYGCKFAPGENPSLKKNNYQLFYNRVALGDNTILVRTGGRKMLYLVYDVLNYMTTQDEKFCNEVQNNLQMYTRRSTIISGVSQKQRNVFFNILLKKIPTRVANNLNQ